MYGAASIDGAKILKKKYMIPFKKNKVDLRATFHASIHERANSGTIIYLRFSFETFLAASTIYALREIDI